MVRLWRDRDYPLCLFVNGQIGFYWTLREWVGTENLSYKTQFNFLKGPF
jgi:hypothetical protein